MAKSGKFCSQQRIYRAESSLSNSSSTHNGGTGSHIKIQDELHSCSHTLRRPNECCCNYCCWLNIVSEVAAITVMQKNKLVRVHR
ncbi:uncharacterized protein LAJ45_07737 [Morchella importuna]|uniref:uncharacterized protein n=1 Tax=Morchella importuna TaxID=1174673 RepID=UPI001E8CA231|nr:uncharacterized protein LAJ45_07737 [Morchella importuna]KAH8148284.1 hypothetical protein LAJ45_07737 [Morchella importuna]